MYIINKGKTSAQPHTTLCIQFQDRENNDKKHTFPLGNKQRHAMHARVIFLGGGCITLNIVSDV